MKFKIDENLPAEVADLIRENNFDAHTVHQEQMIGATDDDILNAGMREERILITLDLDFADIRTYPPGRTPGIVVIRLIRQNKSSIMEITGRLLKAITKEKLAGKLWIVEEDRIRIREGGHKPIKTIAITKK